MVISFVLFGLLILVAILVWITFIKLSDFVSPKTKARGKGKFPIESGERSLFGMRDVGFQYFFYALVFVVFEALLVLIFLWAESAKLLSVYISIPVVISLLYMIILVRYLLKIENEMEERH